MYSLPTDTDATLSLSSEEAYPVPLPPRRQRTRTRQQQQRTRSNREQHVPFRRAPSPPPRPATPGPRPRRYSEGDEYSRRPLTDDSDNDNDMSIEAQENAVAQWRMARMGSNGLPYIHSAPDYPSTNSTRPHVVNPSSHQQLPNPTHPSPLRDKTLSATALPPEASNGSPLSSRRSVDGILRHLSIRKPNKPSSPTPDFPGYVRCIGQREIFLLEPDDADRFDRITEWRDQNPYKSMRECINHFAPLHFPPPTQDLSDALVQLVYRGSECHYDYVLKFSTAKAGSTPANQKQRQKFEIALLRKGLVVEHEPSIDRDDVMYVKILAPFNTLCRTAHEIRLKRRLQSSLFPPLHPTDLVTFTINHLPPPLPTLLGHAIDVRKESAFFKPEDLYKFEGAEQGMAWADIALRFWDSGKRNLLVHNILIHAEIKKHHTLSQLRGTGLRYLLHEKVYTAAYTLHDGPYKDTPSHYVLYPSTPSTDPNLDSAEDAARVEGSVYLQRAKAEVGLNAKPGLDAKAEFNAPDLPKPRRMREWLYNNWVLRWTRVQPLQEVRMYFGEKVAIYFAWLGFYTTWLWIAAPVGFGVFVYGVVMTSSYPELPVATGSTAATTIPATQIISRVFDNATTAPFAFFMSVWTTLFLEFWKRRNYILQWEWDVLEFEKEEQPRPEYYGTTVRISPVTMRDELYYPSSLKLTKAVVSGMLVGASILIVLCTVGTLIVFTAWTRSVHALSGYWSAVVSAMVNLATIMLLNRVYARFAVILTNFENHRTQTMYEGSLIVKHYLFSFINFYSTLFYILIFKQQFGRNLLGQSELDDQCQYGSCMTELTIQLAITFVGRQAIAQGQEVFIPWITKLYYKKRDSLARHQGEYAHHDVTQQHGLPASNPLVSPHPTMVPQWVEDGHLPVYDDSIFTEYNEMVVQFGFVSLFVAAFPLAPLLALLNNVIEVRSDAYKLLTAYQRPVAYQAQDIGMWEKILNILSIISVLTNGAIIAFQSAYMERVLINRFGQENLLASRLGFLIVFEHAVLLLKFLLAYLIPDMPTFVKVAIERESYTARKKLSPADDPSDSDTDTDSSPHSPIPGSGDERIEMDMERGRARSDALARDSALAATAMSEGVPMGRREAPEGKPEKRRRSGKRKARGE